MKRTALAVLLLLSTPFALATPPSDAQVDQLLTVMRARKMVDAMVPQVQASQQQMLQQLTAGQTLAPEQQRRLDGILYKSNAQMLGMLSWNRMQPLYRDIYRQTFSGEDMDAMIGFYGSPAGQNLLDKMPQLMQNTMTAMQKVVVPMLQQMQKDMERAAAGEAAENAPTAAPTAPATPAVPAPSAAATPATPPATAPATSTAAPAPPTPATPAMPAAPAPTTTPAPPTAPSGGR